MKRVVIILVFGCLILLGDNVQYIESQYNDYAKWHEYSGIVSFGLIGATILTNKANRRLHEGLKIATASSMVVTSGLGFLAHKDDIFDLTEGLKKEHWHAILGTIATIAMITTVTKAPNTYNSTLNVIGGVTASVSFIIAKW